MFFPYKDDNPRVLYPFITYSIILINILTFTVQHYIGQSSFIYNYGFIPNKFEIKTIFSSMFMHGGIVHITSNMWFFYIFGDNIESILGHVKFFVFYLMCGIFAAITQFLFDPDSSIPMVGASGAIAGVLGAYMIRFPKARVHVLAIIFIFITTIIVPAQIVLGVWFLIQLSSGLSSIGIDTNGGVAWFAHIGGFIAGVGLLKYFQNFNME